MVSCSSLTVEVLLVIRNALNDLGEKLNGLMKSDEEHYKEKIAKGIRLGRKGRKDYRDAQAFVFLYPYLVTVFDLVYFFAVAIIIVFLLGALAVIALFIVAPVST